MRKRMLSLIKAATRGLRRQPIQNLQQESADSDAAMRVDDVLSPEHMVERTIEYWSSRL